MGGIRALDGTLPAEPTDSTIINSTISGNRAGVEDGISGQGGGISSGPSGVFNLTSVTINDNTARVGSNVFERGQSATFDKTIVSNGNGSANCNGTVASRGDNLEFPGTSCDFEVQADPLLGPLDVKNNGGFTATHELLDGSPAIDAVGVAPAGTVQAQSTCPGPIEDQRTIDRPQDGDANGTAICDIGAFEVTDNNEPPVADDDTAATPQDEPITIEAGDNDQDPNGDALTYEITTDPENGTATINNNGTINYTPDDGFTGDDTLTYTVGDGRGGTDTATVTITVFAVNEFPTARNDTASTRENGSVGIPVLRNDRDSDGDQLRVQRFTRPDNGRVSRGSNGALTYRPDRGFSGRDSFSYTVSDGKGGTDTARVRITVRPAAAVQPRPPAPPAPEPPRGICNGVGSADKIIRGTPGNDVLVGTNGRNTIIGFGGNDRIYACGGNDSIIGNDGKNRIFGGSGNDSINGGRNNDLIVGGSGRDAMNGSGGRDRLFAKDGSKDTVNGGSGRDACQADGRDRKVSCP